MFSSRVRATFWVVKIPYANQHAYRCVPCAVYVVSPDPDVWCPTTLWLLLLLLVSLSTTVSIAIAVAVTILCYAQLCDAMPKSSLLYPTLPFPTIHLVSRNATRRDMRLSVDVRIQPSGTSFSCGQRPRHARADAGAPGPARALVSGTVMRSSC